MADEPKYVVQLEHQIDNNTSVIYHIKDRPLTDDFEILNAKLEYYRGYAGMPSSLGILSGAWLDGQVTGQNGELPEIGVYIVTSMDSNEKYDNNIPTTTPLRSLWPIYTVSNTTEQEPTSEPEGQLPEDPSPQQGGAQSNDSSTNLDEQKWQQIEEWIAELNTLYNNYANNTYNAFVNYNSNYVTLANEPILPCLLLIGEYEENETQKRSAALIDSSGIIWKRQKNNDEYYWTNMFDDKVDITDYNALVYAFMTAIKTLETLKETIDSLKEKVDALGEISTSLGTATVTGEDPLSKPGDDNQTNILIIADETKYKDESTNTDIFIESLIRNKLNLNGTVAWMKANNTKDILNYVTKAGDYYPSFVNNTGDYTIEYAPAGDELSMSIDDFNIILIMLNKNDIGAQSSKYSTSVDKKILDLIGTYVVDGTLEIKADTTKEIETETGNVSWGSISQGYSGKVTKVPVTITYKTVSSAIQGLIKAIQTSNPTALVQVITPITWETDFASDKTLSANMRKAVQSLVNNAKTICAGQGIVFTQTSMINEDNKTAFMDNTDNTIKGNIINTYVSELCNAITTAFKNNQQITFTQTEE